MENIFYYHLFYGFACVCGATHIGSFENIRLKINVVLNFSWCLVMLSLCFFGNFDVKT
jgi:hypothetical protein